MYGLWLFFQKCTGWLLLSILISMKSLLQIYFLRFYFFNFFISSPPNIGLAPSTQGKATVRSIPPPPPLMMIVVDKDRQCRRQQQWLAPLAPSHRHLRQRQPLLTKTTNTAINDNARRRRLHPPPPLLMTTVANKDRQRRRQQWWLVPTAPSHRLLCRGQPLSTKTGLQTNAGSVSSLQGKATVITTM